MTSQEPANVGAAILFSETSTQAIASSYQMAKVNNPRLTLGTLSRKLGIRSKSFLSDVFHGRRILPESHVPALQAALKFSDEAAEVLLVLILRDRCRDESERAELSRRLARLRKLFLQSQLVLRGDDHGAFFALDVFCAFGLQHEPMTLADLKRIFGSASENRLRSALERLAQEKLIVRIQDAPPAYAIQKCNIDLDSFGGGKEGAIEYFRYGIDQLKGVSRQLWAERETALFHHVVLSMKRETLVQEIARFRQLLREKSLEMESQDADVLVRLAFGMHPLS